MAEFGIVLHSLRYLVSLCLYLNEKLHRDGKVFPGQLVGTALDDGVPGQPNLLNNPPPRKPRALHEIEESDPFLACILDTTQLIEGLKLEQFLFHKLERCAIGVICFSELDTYILGLAVDH